MTKIVIIICSVVFPLLAACSDNRGEYARRLSRADSLLPVRPDSAWQVLQEVSLADLRDEGEQAWYALLQTEAAVRGGHSLSGDSLIRVAVDYYDRKGDVEMQARAHYWAGNAYRRLEEEEQALREYWRAEELAREEGDMQLLGAIYNNWAYLFWVNGLEQEADSLYGLAEQIATRRNDSLLLGESWCRSGAIAFDKGKAHYPMAEKLLLQGYGIAKRLDNRQLQRIATSYLSTLYARMEKGEKSLRYAKEYWALQSDTLHCYSAYVHLGEAYFWCEQYDSAVYFMDKALSATDALSQSTAYMRLADIAKNRGDYTLSVEMERKYSACITNNQETVSRQGYSLLDVIANLQMTRMQAKSRQVQKLVYIGMALVFFVIAFGAWRIIHRRRILPRQIAIQSLQKSIVQPEQWEEKQPVVLSDEEKAQWKEEFERSMVYCKIMRILSDSQQHENSQEKLEDEDWQQLEDFLNRRWNSVCLRLRKNEEMRLDDIHVCCLYLVGLSVIDIATVFGYTRDGIYKKSKRILKKISVAHQEENLKDFLNRFSEEG